jgi:hypothetical protein
MKAPTKKQKLEWIRRARVDSERRYVLTCVAINRAGGVDAVDWYRETSIMCMGIKDRTSLWIFDFENFWHRKMWLAMMETLVKANEV